MPELRVGGALMGEVVAVVSVSPEGPETDLDALSDRLTSALPGEAELQGIEERPVAFGMKNLEVTIVMEDAAGGPDLVQEAFEKVDGVQSVKVTDMGRL